MIAKHDHGRRRYCARIPKMPFSRIPSLCVECSRTPDPRALLVRIVWDAVAGDALSTSEHENTPFSTERPRIKPLRLWKVLDQILISMEFSSFSIRISG